MNWRRKLKVLSNLSPCLFCLIDRWCILSIYFAFVASVSPSRALSCKCLVPLLLFSILRNRSINIWSWDVCFVSRHCCFLPFSSVLFRLYFWALLCRVKLLVSLGICYFVRWMQIRFAKLNFSLGINEFWMKSLITNSHSQWSFCRLWVLVLFGLRQTRLLLLLGIHLAWGQ